MQDDNQNPLFKSENEIVSDIKRDRKFYYEPEQDQWIFQYQFLDINNKLDNLKTLFENFKYDIQILKNDLKDLSTNMKSQDLVNVEVKTKIISVESKFVYIDSELKSIREIFGKLDLKFERLTETKSENNKDISVLQENFKSLNDELEEIKQTRKEMTGNTIAIIAIFASIIGSIITGIIDRIK